jgi:predicted alpha/beta-hydrolase family hydrolase
MLKDLSYKYYHKRGSKTVYLVLHGGGREGVETPFITNIISSLSNKDISVFGFNFPYCERGEENSSGEELTEEIETLDVVVKFLHDEGYEKIVIVAKSLGNIITSFWLAKQPDTIVEVVVLGYVLGSVNTEALKGKLKLVIQGANDRFGDAAAVRDELTQHSIEAAIVEVPDADHSYRNGQKEPVFQDKAIQILLENL